MDRLSMDRVDALLRGIRRVRVLVAGDLMLDRYLHGAASRISPEAPVPVVRISGQWRALGGAANVAANVVALGASCTVAGCAGNDAGGAELREALGDAGIDDGGVVTVPDRPTTVKTRVISRHHQVARYDVEVEDDLEGDWASSLAERIRALSGSVDVVVLEDYNKGALVAPVIEAAMGAGVPVIVDPKARNFFAYGGASVFKPNLAELEAALQARVPADDPDWMAGMRERLKCDNLLVTLGEGGMALITDAGEHVRIPAVARSVYDVSGAGDTVTATVAVALAAGATMVEAAILANQAAALEVEKLGVAVITPAELRQAVAERAAGGQAGTGTSEG
ncbi:MAG: PfkB family carbohydrate kinase [Gemmatimonadota bacterium]|jgi:D-beta-D-heptose 7-phosphate kinase/D-beta-D-heptose 1-phosphate adenosyltransferase